MASSLTYTGLPIELKKLANRSMGSGVLRSLFNYSYTYHLLVKVSGDEFIGLALYHYESEHINGEHKKVGIVDCVCVDPSHQKQGFGTLISFSVVRKMLVSQCDSVEMFVKLPKKDKPKGNRKSYSAKIDEFMKLLGFKLQGVYDNYYETKSVKYRYDCIFCHEVPDTCKSVKYLITEEMNTTEAD